MLSKVTNIIPYKIIPLNKNNYSKNIKNNYKTIMNSNNNKGTKINNNKNPKIFLQNAFLKSEMEKINKNNNKDNNKIINKKNYRFFSSEAQNNENKMNINTINENEKNKLNNVTNNICIIIKTSDNKEPEEVKGVRNFGYYDSFKNILNQSYPMSTGNIHIKNIKSSSAFKNKKINNNKIKRYNNSFICNKSSNKKEKGNNSFSKRNNLKINLLKQNKKLINMENKKIEPEVNKLYDDIKNDSIKSRYKNKNCSIFSPKNKRNKNIKCNNLLFGSLDKNYTESSNIIYNDASENFIETKGNIISSTIKKSKKNMYRQSIQQKKELLGINLNVKEKNNIKRKLYEEFIDYEKQREEIEKKIILNDELIKNEEKIKDYKSKKNPIKKVFSDDISVKPNKKYYKSNNKSIEKNNKNLSNDSIVNNDNTISKSDFSYIQTEYNKDETNRFINLSKNNPTKFKKNNNFHFNKNKSNNKTRNKLNYKKSTNNFGNINNKNYKLNTNNSLINSKSCIEIFLEESKIKKNTDIIMHDIIKIMNTNNSKNKNNSPRKIRENAFSPPKNEIIMIQNNEDGKTLRCIKKRCKEKKQNVINEIKPNENIKKESPKKLLDYIINDKEKEKIKEENKKLEIKIPGQQIETLRRIKLKIENYKKGQKKHRNLNYKKFIKYNSFSYLNSKRNFRINTLQIKRLHSLKIANINERFLVNLYS